MLNTYQPCVLLTVLFITNIVLMKSTVRSQHLESPSGVKCDELPCLNVGKQLAINAYSELELICRGDQELEWMHPIPEDVYNEEEYKEANLFVSKFMVNENISIAGDTGEYTCQYKNNTHMNTSTYVYIYDAGEPILLDEPVVYVNVNESLWIKCRPTLPNITVTIATYKNEDRTDNFKFYPQKGFHKEYSNMNDNGVFQCSASQNDAKPVGVTVNIIDPNSPTKQPMPDIRNLPTEKNDESTPDIRTAGILNGKTMLALLVVSLLMCLVLGIFSCCIFKKYRELRWFAEEKRNEDMELKKHSTNQGYDACSDN